MRGMFHTLRRQAHEERDSEQHLPNLDYSVKWLGKNAPNKRDEQKAKTLENTPTHPWNVPSIPGPALGHQIFVVEHTR